MDARAKRSQAEACAYGSLAIRFHAEVARLGTVRVLTNNVGWPGTNNVRTRKGNPFMLRTSGFSLTHPAWTLGLSGVRLKPDVRSLAIRFHAEVVRLGTVRVLTSFVPGHPRICGPRSCGKNGRKCAKMKRHTKVFDVSPLARGNSPTRMRGEQRKKPCACCNILQQQKSCAAKR